MDEKLMKHGNFSWFELTTTDVAAAKAFYAALFGWETKDMPMPGMTYTVVSAGGDEVAGMMAMPQQAAGVPPHWGIYVSVDDVDATVRRAGELGGKVVVPPQAVPGVGRFAVIADPQGATIAAITYERR